MGVDIEPVRAVSRLSAVFVLSRLLGRLFRWQTLRDERGIRAHCCVYVAPLVPQLVPAPLPVCLRRISLREQLIRSEDSMLTQAFTTDINSDLLADVRLGLTKPGQKELPSKYLYDSVGSALFEVISVVPEYGLTRADERLLRRHSEDIVARLAPPIT